VTIRLMAARKVSICAGVIKPEWLLMDLRANPLVVPCNARLILKSSRWRPI
jgi:hypothetical protein